MYVDVKHVIAQRLKQLREENSIMQKELAEKIGATAASVNEWEKGKHTPGASYVATICRTFGVSADWLLGLSEIKCPKGGKKIWPK